jgi:hypothetical protein
MKNFPCYRESSVASMAIEPSPWELSAAGRRFLRERRGRHSACFVAYQYNLA